MRVIVIPQLFFQILINGLNPVGVEEYASSTTIHYHTSSSAPLKRIFTNDVHPIYLAGNTKSPCLPPDLRNKIDKNLANFYGTDVAEADVTAAVPRGLLRSLLTEQFVVHSDYTTTLPAISPHSARTFFSDILFQNAVTELSKEEESPFHDVFDKLVHSDCADPKRISMRNNIFLPFELPAAPIKPVKGALLHTYFVVPLAFSLFSILYKFQHQRIQRGQMCLWSMQLGAQWTILLFVSTMQKQDHWSDVGRSNYRRISTVT